MALYSIAELYIYVYLLIFPYRVSDTPSCLLGFEIEIQVPELHGTICTTPCEAMAVVAPSVIIYLQV